MSTQNKSQSNFENKPLSVPELRLAFGLIFMIFLGGIMYIGFWPKGSAQFIDLAEPLKWIFGKSFITAMYSLICIFMWRTMLTKEK